MGRRRFDQLWTELSVALGRSVPRYPLWLHLCESGRNPQQLERDEALSYCREALDVFLAARGWSLHGRARRRFEARVGRFDAEHPTPEEWFQRLAAARKGSRGLR